jgi:hypothetical protein
MKVRPKTAMTTAAINGMAVLPVLASGELRNLSGFPGAAQHEVVRCRPGIVSNAEPVTIPDQRSSVSRCTASGIRVLSA